MGTRFWISFPLATPTFLAVEKIHSRLPVKRAGAGRGPVLAAAALAALAVTATACGAATPTSSGITPTTANSTATRQARPAATHADGQAPPAATHAADPAQPAAPTTAHHGCTIPVVLAIAGESDSADASRTASWTTLQANDWTVFVPDSDWHLSASTAGGADIFSPDGGSAANLGDKEAQTPWTLATLGQVALGSVSNLNIICRSSIERSASLTTQATEFTGDYQGVAIHGVVALSLLTPTTPNFFAGEIRSIYTPAAQWSTSAEQTLWLIIKHAVFVPPQQQP